jgi:hypothetical protein
MPRILSKRQSDFALRLYAPPMVPLRQIVPYLQEPVHQGDLIAQAESDAQGPSGG